MSYNERMDKPTLKHPYNEIQLSNKTGQLTCNWLWLKGIRLSENTQSEKVIYYIIPFIGHSQKDKTLPVRTDQWLPGARRGEKYN